MTAELMEFRAEICKAAAIVRMNKLDEVDIEAFFREVFSPRIIFHLFTRWKPL